MNKYEVKKLYNRTEYYEDGKLHRLNGPAIEWNNGDKDWYQNGLRHRLGNPAVENSDGSKAWYQNGEFHRLYGPAVEWTDGEKSWYIEGDEYTEEEFNKIISGKNEVSQLKQEIAEKDELIKSYQKIINNLLNEKIK